VSLYLLSLSLSAQLALGGKYFLPPLNISNFLSFFSDTPLPLGKQVVYKGGGWTRERTEDSATHTFPESQRRE
jgi:hypothetical protein